MINRKQNRIALALIVLLTISACAFQNAELKRQGFIYADTYQREYYAVEDALTDPKATTAQKDIALTKKSVLRRLWPMIKTYDSIVAKGEVPPDQLVQDISMLIDELVKIGGESWQSQKH